jgi:hypothetical protein
MEPPKELTKDENIWDDWTRSHQGPRVPVDGESSPVHGYTHAQLHAHGRRLRARGQQHAHFDLNGNRLRLMLELNLDRRTRAMLEAVDEPERSARAIALLELDGCGRLYVHDDGGERR